MLQLNQCGKTQFKSREAANLTENTDVSSPSPASKKRARLQHSNSVEYFAVTEVEESEESPMAPSPLKPKMNPRIVI